MQGGAFQRNTAPAFEYTAEQLQKAIMSALADGNTEAVRGLLILLGIHYPADFEQFKAAFELAQALKDG